MSKSLMAKASIAYWRTRNFLACRRLGLPICIGLETATACNRRCHYCPQSVDPMKQQQVSEDVWQMFLWQLQRINWKGLVGLTRYNEPGFTPGMTEKLRLLKAVLPDCRPILFSNGDWPDKVREWVAAGAYKIHVTERS